MYLIQGVIISTGVPVRGGGGANEILFDFDTHAWKRKKFFSRRTQ